MDARMAMLDNQNSLRGTDEGVMTYERAAEFLAVSERTLERYVREGLVPYVRMPKRGARAGIRFLRSDLIRWLERQSVRPRRSSMTGGG